MTELAVVYRSVDELIPYARNARTHSGAQVAQIAASIREFSFTNPVLLDGDSGILAGHGRVLAARKLGMTEAPCIPLRHLTDAQRRAYMIADNKLGLNAGWDAELLQLAAGYRLSGAAGALRDARGPRGPAMTDPTDEAPALFRACREALTLSAAEMAAALHVGSGRTVRKWEAGEHEVLGPVWVALRYVLMVEPASPQRRLAGRVDAVLAVRSAA